MKEIKKEAKNVAVFDTSKKCPVSQKACLGEDCALYTCYEKQGSVSFFDCGLKKITDIAAPNPK